MSLLGLIAEMRGGPDIFQPLAVGATVILSLLLLYRLLEVLDWVAFPEKKPPPLTDEELEDQLDDDLDYDEDVDIDYEEDPDSSWSWSDDR